MQVLAVFLALIVSIQASWGEEIKSPGIGEPQVSRSSGRIAEGTVWETGYVIVDSGVQGATVLIIAGMHGNEPAGSHAAEQITEWPIRKGKLIVISRANVLGLKANTRLIPGQPKEAGNLNRNFPQVEAGDLAKVLPRGELASALWAFAFKARPDWVLDLHEGIDFRRSHEPPEGKDRSVGSSVIYRGGRRLDGLVERVVAAADATVTDPEKCFSVIRGGPVSTGIARACITGLRAEGMILETTFKGQPMSLRARQHRAMVNVLLNHIGLIEEDCRDRLAAPKSSEILQVAVFDGVGTGPSRQKVVGVIEAATDLALHHIGPDEMRPEVLEQFDVVLFPGGSGSKQAKDIGEKGRAAVRGYVEAGGGVVGVCAGAYLCSAQYSWSLDLIDSKVFTGSAEIPGKGRKQLWYRGRETGIDMELTPKGESLFGPKGIPREFEVRYCNGPIISPKDLEELEDYEVLAWFRSENGLWKPQEGTMINTPAIVSGRFGKGRVITVSPHPELTPALHPILTQTIRWTAKEVR